MIRAFMVGFLSLVASIALAQAPESPLTTTHVIGDRIQEMNFGSGDIRSESVGRQNISLSDYFIDYGVWEPKQKTASLIIGRRAGGLSTSPNVSNMPYRVSEGDVLEMLLHRKCSGGFLNPITCQMTRMRFEVLRLDEAGTLTVKRTYTLGESGESISTQ